MSMVKVKLDTLGGVSCIQWTECGPPRGPRLKDCESPRESTRTSLQSNVMAYIREGRESQVKMLECRNRNGMARSEAERSGKEAAAGAQDAEL